MRADPDAIWKPGFTGEVVYPARAAAALSTGVRRGTDRWSWSWWWWWSLAAAVLAGAVFVITRRDGTPAAESVERVPTQVEERWSTTVPGQVWNVIGTGDVLLASSLGPSPTITALGADTGAELWSRSGERGTFTLVGVVDGTAVFLSNPRTGPGELIGLEARTGASRWSRPLPEPTGVAWVAGPHVIVSRPVRTDPAAISGLELVDPSDGSVDAVIGGADVRVTATDVQFRDGDTFTVYDLDTFALAARVEVPMLRRAPAALVRVGSSVLAVTTDEVLLLDAGGNVVRAVELPRSSPRVVPSVVVFGDRIVVQTSDSIVGLEISDGDIRIVWRRQAQVIDGLTDGPRPLLAVSTSDAANQSSSDVPVEVLDAPTGNSIWSGRLALPGRGRPILTATGFVANRPGTDRDGRRVAIMGVDLDGDTMWRLPVGRWSDTVVVTDALVELVPTPGDKSTTTITLRR